MSDEKRAIYEKMADIAAVFHWSYEGMMGLPASELDTWHRLAVERFTLCRQTSL